MLLDHLQEQGINLLSENEKEKLRSFLKKQKLSLDNDIEYSMILLDDDNIVATGSFSNNVLKCIAVDDEYKSFGLSARVITHLLNEQHRRGRTHLFIYTKPENRRIFSELGFYPIADVKDKVVLMENRINGIKNYLDEIAGDTGEIVPSGSVVVNCNPFTNGHKYLLEYAASKCQLLHVFVVWEDKSLFPVEVRYRLVKEGTSHLKNVIVHRGKDYIISNATFPSYFLKEYEDIVETHAMLDLTIFSEYIAKKLDIMKRFVGEEPFCVVTAAYNKIMKRILPQYDIEVEEIKRLSADGSAISASRVREMIHQGNIKGLSELVPETTYRFLVSNEAKDIIETIRAQK